MLVEELNKKYLKELEECNTGDREGDHINADAVLYNILIDLGYTEIVEKFQEIDKWYA